MQDPSAAAILAYFGSAAPRAEAALAPQRFARAKLAFDGLADVKPEFVAWDMGEGQKHPAEISPTEIAAVALEQDHLGVVMTIEVAAAEPAACRPLIDQIIAAQYARSLLDASCRKGRNDLVPEATSVRSVSFPETAACGE